LSQDKAVRLVAHGYVGPGINAFCRCCRSGPKSKFLCETCLHVCKAPHLGFGGGPRCPAGHGLMRDMGDKWRPAKKARRTVPPLLAYQRYPGRGYPSDGELLLERLRG